MAIVFKTPKSTLNTTSKAIQNLGGDCPPCPEPVLESKELEYTQNGEYTVTPEEGVDGFSQVDITVNIPSDVNNQNKSVTISSNGESTISADSGYSGLGEVTVTVDVDPVLARTSVVPTTSLQTITPPQGYDGFEAVNVLGVDSNIDPNILSNNIKNGITILGVTGSYTAQPDLQAKTVNPSTSQQTVTPDQGKDGLSSVTVTAVTNTIDANIQAGNIKKDVSILGVTGNYDPQPTLTTLNVTPTTSAQQITPSQEDGYDEVNVAAVTSAIDQNIAAGNIKDGVTILGVTGSYSGASINNQNKTVSPTTSQQSISADQGYTGLGTVTVNAVTAAIDANIVAENILDGVTILGVTGSDLGYDVGYSDGYAQGQAECPEPGGCDHTAYIQETITTNGTYTYDPSDYQGDSYDAFDGVEITVNVSGGTNVPDWSSIGWTSQDVTDSGIVADVAYTATVKDNNSWSNDQTLVFAPKQSNGSGGIFMNCSQLAFVPDFTFTGTNVSYRNAFNNCPALESIGSISCPNVTSSRDADSMFSGCTHLTYIKNIDMKNCRRGGNMFGSCWALKDVSLTNMEQMEDIETFLQNTAYITTIRSMSGLGKGFVNISSSVTYSGLEHTLDLSAQQYGLTKQSIMTVINDIVAPDDSNVNDATIKLSAASYALLDASDIAIATAKNWSVISA